MLNRLHNHTLYTHFRENLEIFIPIQDTMSWEVEIPALALV